VSLKFIACDSFGASRLWTFCVHVLPLLSTNSHRRHIFTRFIRPTDSVAVSRYQRRLNDETHRDTSVHRFRDEKPVSVSEYKRTAVKETYRCASGTIMFDRVERICKRGSDDKRSSAAFATVTLALF
jgi:hypothetical protein